MKEICPKRKDEMCDCTNSNNRHCNDRLSDFVVDSGAALVDWWRRDAFANGENVPD